MTTSVTWTSGSKSFGITRNGHQIIRCRKGGITKNPMIWKVYDKAGAHLGDYDSEEAALAATT
jgi:hypothetical protein